MLSFTTDVVFCYGSPSFFRTNEGIPQAVDGGPSDARLKQAIIRNSNIINRVTRQYFQPVKQAVLIDGNGSRWIQHPDLVPIVDLTVVSSVSPLGCKIPVEKDAYTIDGRHVARKTFNAPVNRARYLAANELYQDCWQKGVQNYELDGVFGWIDRRRKLTTKLQTDITINTSGSTTTFDVSDATGLNAGDSILIGDQHFFVISISGNTITVDNPLENVGAQGGNIIDVCRHGVIPPEIIHCVALLLADELVPLASGFGSDDAIDADLGDRIKKEKVDNYSYDIGRTPNDDASRSLLKGGTGNLKVDAMLARFSAPRSAMFV